MTEQRREKENERKDGINHRGVRSSKSCERFPPEGIKVSH